jgi:hypothetical protein
MVHNVAMIPILGGALARKGGSRGKMDVTVSVVGDEAAHAPSLHVTFQATSHGDGGK